jgi:Flp pilus assembly pilin Flp
MKKLQRVRNFIKRKVQEGVQILQDESGLSVIEMLLILVVIIALVLIFKNQLVNLVNVIFEKITSESAGI